MTALQTSSPARPPVGRSPSPARTVIRQLVPLEARRFSAHPTIWVAMALGTWMFLADLLSVRWLLPRESIHVQYVALPIGAVTLVLAHLAATRPRRDDVAELLAPAVHGEDTRLLALLIAALTPAVMTAGLIAVLLGGMAVLGAAGPVAWAEAATPPVVVAGAGVLGVLLGRVAPWKLASLFALVALVTFQFLIAPGAPGSASTLSLFAPLIETSSARPDPSALLRPAGPHLAYVVGAVLLLVTLARLTTRVTMPRIVAAVAALAVTVTAGVTQLQAPADAEVQALLARVGDPIGAGDCTTSPTGAEVCALPELMEWRDSWVDLVDGVRAPLLSRDVDPGPLTVAQRAAPGQAEYVLSRWFEPEEVDVHGHIEVAWDAEYRETPGTLLVTSEWSRGSADADPSQLDLAVHAAARAVELPGSFRYLQEAPDGSVTSLRPCVHAGEAREAVTLWLAAQSDPSAAGALREAVTDQPYPGAVGGPVDPGSDREASLWLDLWTPAVPTISATWSQTGAHVALQLLDLPQDDVLTTLTVDWDHWTDPSTSLRELVEEFGLAMPPLADAVRDEVGGDTAYDLDQALRDTPLSAPGLGVDGGNADEGDEADGAKPTGCT